MKTPLLALVLTLGFLTQAGAVQAKGKKLICELTRTSDAATAKAKITILLNQPIGTIRYLDKKGDFGRVLYSMTYLNVKNAAAYNQEGRESKDGTYWGITIAGVNPKTEDEVILVLTTPEHIAEGKSVIDGQIRIPLYHPENSKLMRDGINLPGGGIRLACPEFKEI